MKDFKFSNPDHQLALVEIHDSCFFETQKESETFWTSVADAGEFESNEPISQDSFELAHLKAKELLFEQGMKVFKRKKIRIQNFAS